MSDGKRFDLLIVDAGSRKIVVYTPRFENIRQGDIVNFFFDGDAASGTVINVYTYKEYQGEFWNALTTATGHDPVKCISRTFTDSIEWTEEDEITPEENDDGDSEQKSVC